MRTYPTHQTIPLRVQEWDLSTRTTNCLEQNGVTDIGKLLHLSEYDLLRFKNMGRKSVKEVVSFLAEYGLELRSARVVGGLAQLNVTTLNLRLTALLVQRFRDDLELMVSSAVTEAVRRG